MNTEIKWNTASVMKLRMGEIVIGMHRRNSKYAISPADDCLIVHEDFNKIVRKNTPDGK